MGADETRMTNRDFYKGLERLMMERRDKPDVSLEDYLRSLRARARQVRAQQELSLETLYALLADSFSPAVESADAGNMQESADGFAEWDSVIEAQIQDLRSMSKNGQL